LEVAGRSRREHNTPKEEREKKQSDVAAVAASETNRTNNANHERKHTMLNNRSRFIAAFALVALVLTALPALAADGKVNVNTASAQQLAMLPHVGPSVAERIVEHRAKNGQFKSIEDLALVKGIGDKTLEQLKPYVAISGETTLSAKVKTGKTSAAASSKSPAAPAKD
jgi:competence protein ComEA